MVLMASGGIGGDESLDLVGEGGLRGELGEMAVNGSVVVVENVASGDSGF